MEETMPIKMRRYYLDTIRERYKNALKSEKTKILDEFCFVSKYSRKYAIRALNGEIEPRLNRPGPKPKYGPQVIHHLRILWSAMTHICSKKMVSALPIWLEHYSNIDAETKRLLLMISASTIDRLLKPFKKQRGISTTRPPMIKSKVPIKLLDGDIDRPGYVEADTVAHCGNTAFGSFVNSLTMTDLFSGWTANRAIWTKASVETLSQIRKVEERLPFELLGFASDNGGEFINEDLHAYFEKRLRPIEFVRRRPYKKNDAAHVEQKNFTHVRELFGYQRFDDPELIPLMNEIYQAYWNPLQNLFIPVLKLKSKTRIGGKLIKKYDEPKTPCQRLLDSPHVPLFKKRMLKEQLMTKNPFYLKQELDKKLKQFFEAVDRLRRKEPLSS
jgi:hypothetical protein